MLIAQLAGIALVINVSTGPVTQPNDAAAEASPQQKSAAIHSLTHSATECIARAVAADPRFNREANGNVGDLIVDSIPSCVGPVRAMIDAYDDYFGEGTGEAFFMGPYLEKLPIAVIKWGTNSARDK
ncbi:MAG TPA: hypothetical protein VKT73_12510 [Xanthobacteraceae bacterium]|nr:hypothetical protein [Xanthobacteraceae bacterium]